MRKYICLLLVLALALACFSGCRGKKEEPQAEPVQQAEPEQEEPMEITLPEGQQGITADEEPFEIDVPEDSELGGD